MIIEASYIGRPDSNCSLSLFYGYQFLNNLPNTPVVGHVDKLVLV